MDLIESRLNALVGEPLRALQHGIERECLRIDDHGGLSHRPHPAGLGSALTHPRITTDFCEAQIEMVTGVHPDIDGCLAELAEIHALVARGIDDELLWATSMPCRLPADDEIPIGQYGSSNIGRLKTIYRIGLAHRYGRRMQTISGVHYNFSLPESGWSILQAHDGQAGSERDYRDAGYFSLIRNFRRHSWLLLYLFGASPAVCGSFVAGRTHRLQPIGAGSMYLPFGTSMRMGPLGYQSEAQRSLAISFNDLQGYARSLTQGLTQAWPPYVDIGVREGDEYRQLSTSLLQIENEFYGTIRPKRRILPGERPLHALDERGVEYVEVRCLDIDPFEPIGVAQRTARLLDVFLLHCLLSDSRPDSAQTIAIDSANQLLAAERGREPGLSLQRADGSPIALAAWGEQILRECAPIARALDDAQGTDAHSVALEHGLACLALPSLTPSARVLEAMAQDHENSYQRFAMAFSRAHRQSLRQTPLSEQVMTQHQESVARSWQEQHQIEAEDSVDFETFRERYLAQELRAPRPETA
ncbi:MAG: glutamate--cysteine ligase [Burkholderiaceae bacterium]